MSMSSVPGRRSGIAGRAMVSNNDTNADWCRLSTPGRPCRVSANSPRQHRAPVRFDVKGGEHRRWRIGPLFFDHLYRGGQHDAARAMLRGSSLMRARVIWAFSVAALLAGGPAALAQRSSSIPDLQGAWNGSTLTPLQRPEQFKERVTFTPEEAAEYVRGSSDRIRARLPTSADRQMQIDIDDTFVEVEQMPLDGLRTSRIVDPPDGMLPALLPAAKARIAARPKRSFEDPETFGLAERCLLGNFGASGGSLASPPMVPSQAIPSFYRIVQTETHVMIFTEWVHDARIIRLNGIHHPPGIRSWLGDSVGHYEGQTLVVDTTNFRRDTHNLDSGERLHVVERFTRVDAKTLRYRVTVEDPDTWTTPWTAEWPFRASDAPMFSVECHEGNYAIEHFLRGARADEQRAHALRRDRD